MAAPASLLQLYDSTVGSLKREDEEYRAALQARIETASARLSAAPPLPPDEHSQLTKDVERWKAQMTRGLQGMEQYILRAIPFLNRLYSYEEQRDRERAAAQAAGDAKREAHLSVQWSNTVQRLTAEFVRELHPELESAQSVRARQAPKTVACQNCGATGKIRREGDVNVCMAADCGMRSGTAILSSSFADCQRTRTVRRFRYARINHLREFLRQRQALQKNAPNAAVTELVREGIRTRWPALPPQMLRPCHIHDVLKWQNLSRFYKYIYYLTRQLNPDYEPPYMDPRHCERLTYLFYKAEAAFNRTKDRVDANRENLISYRYVCKQLCRLLGAEFAPYLELFPDLKSVELQQKQDRFWKEICKELKWPYMPSTGNQRLAQDFRAPRADDGLVAVQPDQEGDEMEPLPELELNPSKAKSTTGKRMSKKKRTKSSANPGDGGPQAEDETLQQIPKRLRRITKQQRAISASMRKLSDFVVTK